MPAPSDGLPDPSPTQTVQCGLPPDLPLAGSVNLAPMRRTSEPWTPARIDATASNRTHHRRQERVQPWQLAMVDSLHISGVVSRVPCSSRYASAFGTDRNTYLTSAHQRGERIPAKTAGEKGDENQLQNDEDFDEVTGCTCRCRCRSPGTTSSWRSAARSPR